MVSLSAYINTLSGRGGTDIFSGMQLAIRTIKERKHVNSVTSVFLLSDGQDKSAEIKLKQHLEK